MPLLAAEIVRDVPGQETVLDRLLDLLLISALRTWFARPDAPAWYRAHTDPVVGQALRLLQHQPAEPWTVAKLAANVGVSRAAFARRFTDGAWASRRWATSPGGGSRSPPTCCASTRS